MLNGFGKLSSVSTTNVCRSDGDVLSNTLEDELHTMVPLLLKPKLTSILHPYNYVKSMGWFTNNCIPALLISSINAIPHSTIACNVSDYSALACALKKIFREPLGLPSISAGVPTPKRWSLK